MEQSYGLERYGQKRKSMRRDTVKDYLNRLKVKGLLLREGSVRSGSWLLTPVGKAAIEEG